MHFCSSFLLTYELFALDTGINVNQSVCTIFMIIGIPENVAIYICTVTLSSVDVIMPVYWYLLTCC